MERRIPAVALLAVACGPAGARLDEVADPWADAELRITAPTSGTFLPLEEPREFAAVVLDAAGLPVEVDPITWTASADVTWQREGATFTDDLLDVGLHDLTAEVVLPNGDRLAHTVGGVLLQSMYAGTWSGLFTTDVQVDQYVATCSGTVLLVVDPYGEAATGDASCLVSLQGFDLELAYVFDLTNDAGTLTGTAGADVFGFTTYDLPATGQLDPESGVLTLDFAGDIDLFAFQAQIDGVVDADRVSRDAGLQPAY